MMKLRVVAWIPAEVDETNFHTSLGNARKELEHLQLLQPNDRFIIERRYGDVDENDWRQVKGTNTNSLHATNEFRVRSFMRVDPDESVSALSSIEEAEAEISQMIFMQPENLYEIEQFAADGWEVIRL